ncbi:DNA topology modulation protein FlaR [Salipaludibacillus neizhouensis]|uniref:DNA topology modulation protein FlaR n=1 Tax=Salipaludibacillus neizhouensis TaxID=885475 RepID=A0A3A9JYY1_9BACI|nr:AAA family ATPase [Salipaludibacillus neizhouensis]RKL65399.1 DNA topology modulation protein FlaR [Salipaludibacillus neizhouensis]
MKKRIPKKIHIIGFVGSGKTTLAKELSTKYSIPFHELDNVVWIRDKAGDIKRTEKEREDYLNKIIQSESWIIEGIHNEDWVANSFRHADLIIFLDTKYSIRTSRITKRFLYQKLGLEKSNYKPTIKIFFNMFKWNKQFEDRGKPKFFERYGIYRDKIFVANNKKYIISYLNSWQATLRRY